MAVKTFAEFKAEQAAPAPASTENVSVSGIKTFAEFKAEQKKKPVAAPTPVSVTPTAKPGPVAPGPRKALLPQETISAPEAKPYGPQMPSFFDRAKDAVMNNPVARVIAPGLNIAKAINDRVKKDPELITKVKGKITELGDTKNAFTTSIDVGMDTVMNRNNPLFIALKAVKAGKATAKGEQPKETNFATHAIANFAIDSISSLEDIYTRAKRGLDVLATPGSSRSQKANAILDVGLAGANTLFLPVVTEFNAQKAAVAATGPRGTKAIKVVDKGFGALTKLGAYVAERALADNDTSQKNNPLHTGYAAIPDNILSPTAKEHLRQNTEEVAGQISMLLGMALLHGAVQGKGEKVMPKTEAGIGDAFKKAIGIDSEGIPTKEEVETSYKKTMQSFAGKPDYEARASVATTAYKALTDYHELSPEEFSAKWVETTKALESQIPQLKEEIQSKIAETGTHAEAEKTLQAREAPIGDTEAGYRTQGDLSEAARAMYAAETVENIKAAIQEEAAKEDTSLTVRAVDDPTSSVPAKTDLQTGEIIVNPRAIIQLADKMEEANQHNAGESRVELEQRLVREEVERQRAAFDAMTPKQELKYKSAVETGDVKALEKVQKEVAAQEAPATNPFSQKPEEVPATNPTASKPSKVSEDIKKLAIEKGLMSNEDLVAEYGTKNLKDQSAKISDILASGMKDARAMIRGEKPVPEGISPQLFFETMAELGNETGDAELLYDLKDSPLTTERSLHAQELRMSQGADPDSALANLRRAERAKKDAIPKVEKKTSEIVKEIKKEVKKQKEPKTAKEPRLKKPITRETWNSFVDSIVC